MANLAALGTQPNPHARLQQKLALTRHLYRKGWGRETILKLYYFIDAVMTLPDDLKIQYNHEVHELEEENKVAFITTAEEIGMRKGLEQGRQEGERELLKKQLRKKFSHRNALDSYESAVDAADEDLLMFWGEKILVANSPQEVFGY